MEGPNQKQRSLILTQGVIVGLSGGTIHVLECITPFIMAITHFT